MGQDFVSRINFPIRCSLYCQHILIYATKMYFLPGNTTDIQLNVSGLVYQLINQFGTSSYKYQLQFMCSFFLLIHNCICELVHLSLAHFLMVQFPYIFTYDRLNIKWHESQRKINNNKKSKAKIQSMLVGLCKEGAQ